MPGAPLKGPHLAYSLRIPLPLITLKKPKALSQPVYMKQELSLVIDLEDEITVAYISMFQSVRALDLWFHKMNHH